MPTRCLRASRTAGAIVAGCASILAGCGSSAPHPNSRPELCAHSAVAVQTDADRHLDWYPTGGPAIQIGDSALIHGSQPHAGCQAKVTYTVTAAVEPLSALDLTARSGSTTAHGTPLLHSPAGVSRWQGSVTIPVPADADTLTIQLALTSYQYAGKSPVHPVGGDGTMPLYLVVLSGF